MWWGCSFPIHIISLFHFVRVRECVTVLLGMHFEKSICLSIIFNAYVCCYIFLCFRVKNPAVSKEDAEREKN